MIDWNLQQNLNNVDRYELDMTQTACTRRYYLFKDNTGRFSETILIGIFERVIWWSYTQ